MSSRFPIQSISSESKKNRQNLDLPNNKENNDKIIFGVIFCVCWEKGNDEEKKVKLEAEANSTVLWTKVMLIFLVKKLFFANLFFSKKFFAPKFRFFGTILISDQNLFSIFHYTKLNVIATLFGVSTFSHYRDTFFLYRGKFPDL